MKPKSLIPLIVGLGIGVLAIKMGFDMVQQARGEQGEPRRVLISAKEIPVATRITEKMLTTKDIPEVLIPADAFTDRKTLVGRVTKMAIPKGLSVTKAMLAPPGAEPGLRAKIPRGFRAVSVQVNEATAVAGFVTPGSRVDVLVFLKEGGDVPNTGAYTILKNVRVFAVNEKVDREIDSQGQTISAKTVSLLVKPDQVEKLLVASSVGRLELSLRRPDDETDDERESDDMTALADLLRSRGKSGVDEEKPRSRPRESNQSFAEFLLQESGPKAAKSEPVMVEPTTFATMLVMTPEGATEFRWTDPNQLPESVPGPTAAPLGAPVAAPAPSPSLPTTPNPLEGTALGPSLPSGLEQLIDTPK